MTLTSTTQTASFTPSSSDGESFTYGFDAFQKSEIKVVVIDSNGDETTKTEGSDYTVDLTNQKVTWIGTSPDNTNTIRIDRFIVPKQNTDYIANDAFPAQTHEDALDKLTMQVQWLMRVVDTVTYDNRINPSICKAWVTFDGTDSDPITPDASYNINGNVTKNGTGDYTVSWDTNFVNTHYAVVGTAAGSSGDRSLLIKSGQQKAGSVQIFTVNAAGTKTDADRINLVAFGDQ